MMRRCEPLHDGDTHQVCGALFDDNLRMAVCPHVSLFGGDTKGVPGDPGYLAAKHPKAKADLRAPLPQRLRQLGLVSDVPSDAPPPPLGTLDDFDPEHGHVRAPHGSPQYERCARGGCSCTLRLYRLADATRRAYEAKPAAMMLRPEDVDLALGASVMRRGVVGTVVYLLRRHAPNNAVEVLHQAASELRPPVDPDQRSYAERLRERLGMVPRPATPERPRCTCKPTRVAGMGGLFVDPGCPTHGHQVAPVQPPTGL